MPKAEASKKLPGSWPHLGGVQHAGVDQVLHAVVHRVVTNLKGLAQQPLHNHLALNASVGCTHARGRAGSGMRQRNESGRGRGNEVARLMPGCSTCHCVHAINARATPHGACRSPTQPSPADQRTSDGAAGRAQRLHHDVGANPLLRVGEGLPAARLAGTAGRANGQPSCRTAIKAGSTLHTAIKAVKAGNTPHAARASAQDCSLHRNTCSTRSLELGDSLGQMQQRGAAAGHDALLHSCTRQAGWEGQRVCCERVGGCAFGRRGCREQE